MNQLKDRVARIVSFVGRNKIPFGFAGVAFIAIVVWLLHRDGFKPEESAGEITITTSGGDVLMTVPEQTATTETQTDENL